MKDQTVGSVIRNVLPTGSVELPDFKVDGTISLTWKWEICPPHPMDVFAVAAYLLKVGGVIAFFEPSPFTEKDDLSRGQFVLSTADRKLADTAGEMWRDAEKNPKGFPPNYVQTLWRQLIRHWDDPVTPGSYLGDDADNSKWWRWALKLVMISDMACNRILRDPVGPFKRSPFEEFVEDWYLTPYREDDKLTRMRWRRGGASGMETPRPPASLTLLADRSVVCVLPKVRVAPVGATLRNLTRNLSLLPGRGEVRCSWYDLPEPANGEDQETLDILLIPEPATLEAKCFRPHEDVQRTQKNLHYWKKDWDNFHLDQTWIKGEAKRELFLKNCENLLKSAKDQSRRVNGIVLPEYAVDYALFEDLCTRLKKVEPGLEFIISGSSDNCREADGCPPEPGNHVLTRVWYGAADLHRTTSRRKHHRWRMDRSQVETYALSSSLNPKIKYWWESCPLGRREVHFHRFRKRSVFSVLICEELARSDPCHEILRSVAPNLIFALLLDGPQIRNRWPAQYASNLADDPGSSVLTITSYGLIDRANRQGKFDPCHSFAMWKDETGKIVEIDMPKGDGPRAVLLSLWSEHVSDRTIAGKNNLARSWRYSSHYPVFSPRT